MADGSCITPGVPLDGCADGFVHDGVDSCAPVLPPDACPTGTMAVPGDESCRSVMACGDGTWGDLPLDATTQHVDAAYVGSDSDGSAARPWTTIADAVAAAVPGALIALAAGSYGPASLYKPVRLWGVCPELVEVVAGGTTCLGSALCVRAGGAGSEIGGLELRGGGGGIDLIDTANIVLSNLHVHDNDYRGIHVERATDVVIEDVLVEDNADTGIFAMASDVIIRRSQVRRTTPRQGIIDTGRGIVVSVACHDDASGLDCDEDAPASATIESCVVEENELTGVFVMGSMVELDAAVVRSNFESTPDGERGHGVLGTAVCDTVGTTYACNASAPATVSVEQSVVSGNATAGVAAISSTMTVANSVIADTRPLAVGEVTGVGVAAVPLCDLLGDDYVCDPLSRADVRVEASTITANALAGAFADGSDLELHRTVVRDTRSHPFTLSDGRGLLAMSPCSYANDLRCDVTMRPNLVCEECLITASAGYGIVVANAEVALRRSAVSNTLLGSDAGSGAAIHLNPICRRLESGALECFKDSGATATVAGTRIVGQHHFGIVGIDVDLTVQGSLIGLTASGPDLFGDGIAIVSELEISRLSLQGSRITDSARAGLAVFGGEATMAGTAISCADISISAEPHAGHSPALQDGGGNLCGCPEPNEGCIASSTGISPPGQQ